MKKKFSTLILIFISFVSIVACIGVAPPTPPKETSELTATLDPVAVFALTEISLVYAQAQETVASLGEMATAASYTLTPTPEPVIEERIKNLLNESISLNYAFSVGCSVEKVEFTPDTGNNIYENLVIIMKCAGEENEHISPERAFVDLILAYKDSRDSISNLMPEQTKYMQLWLNQPKLENYPQAGFDIRLADVKNYVDGYISAEEFRSKVVMLMPYIPTPEAPAP